MPDRQLPPTVTRLLDALRDHDLDGVVACFAEDYVNRTPVHPARGFRGRQQVRANWAHIFTAVPDVRARVLRGVRDGHAVWTEWELSGTRTDLVPFHLRGVVVLEIPAAVITAATFYLEPVDHDPAGADQAVRRVAGDGPPPPSKEPS
jgi:ketosteroid isomerase-like protein